MVSGSGATTEFDHLVASSLDIKWHLDPVEATGFGLSQYDHLLGSYGVDDVRQHLAALKSVAGALEELNSESLDEEIDKTALLNDLRVNINKFEHEKPHVRNPAFWLSHALDGLYQLTVLRDRPQEHRAWAIESRLRALPGFLDSARRTLGDCPEVFRETAGQLAESGASLIDDVSQALERDRGSDAADVCTAACEALSDFGTYIDSGALDGADDSFAIGERAFNFRLHYEHALQSTAAELWRYGLDLMERAERDLTEVAREVDPALRWQSVVDRLRLEPTPHRRLVEAYQAEAGRAQRFVVDHDLMTVPEGELQVVETPPFLRSVTPFAAYHPPGAFADDRIGRFYVTPPGARDGSGQAGVEPHDFSVHEIPGTVVHEGFPGHHLQFLHAQSQPRVVRKVIGTPLTVEGWALYCELLMDEEGYFRIPEERLFHRLAMLWRAARIVLDVGLHTRGMSVADASRFLVEQVHFEPGQAGVEVRRYCAQPAYQLCYAVGLRELLELRDSYHRAKGGEYTAKGFHEAVLAFGGLPVSMMRWGMQLSA